MHPHPLYSQFYWWLQIIKEQIQFVNPSLLFFTGAKNFIHETTLEVRSIFCMTDMFSLLTQGILNNFGSGLRANSGKHSPLTPSEIFVVKKCFTMFGVSAS